MAKKIRELFASDISRRIEEVIKVDQADSQIVRDEIAEYVVTDSLRRYFVEILERYDATRREPHEGIGAWVSGFFGSGKSSFAKYLGLALEDRDLGGEGAAELLARRAGDKKVEVLLKTIGEHLPTHAVIFDVSTDRGIRTGSQTLTEIMYRLFLQSLGYARDLDLSELEITLEGDGRLEAFEARYRELYDGKDWNQEKGKIALAVQQASRVMHELDPETFTTVESWRESAMRRADVTPGLLAERCLELMARRRPGKTLVFVADEVGQFVARDVQKMLDLQAVVQNFGRLGRGRLWLVVTSQERLDEMVSGIDDRRVEINRLRDRFPLQVHLEPSDISEVTSRRVLAKKSDAQAELRELFANHRGRLGQATRLSADVRLPELETDRFIELYPLLPYQISLIIDVVSGLRTAGGASKHVGGANRTIIKLAQQLLIHPGVELAAAEVGVLARLDQVYDLVSGNIASEVRRKIAEVGAQVTHPLAPAVAKTICLLDYARSVHRTAENLAAALHPTVDADPRSSEVRTALDELERAKLVRRGEDGYRIPSLAEDDWENQRGSLRARPGDVHRLHAETLAELWKPQPQHHLLEVRTFKAGLHLHGRSLVEGDVVFHLTLAEAGADYEERVDEARKRSRAEPGALFWVAALHEAIERETEELFRSREILSRKERGARTGTESALVAEEKLRLRRHRDELQRLLKQALVSGSLFFRGNDRSPEEGTAEVGRAASRALAQALPAIYERFEEAAARVAGKDLEALLTNENLRGLTPVFSELDLVRDPGGKPAIATESGPLAEVLARIENRTSYGESATGRWLAEEFGREPFGWSFDAVRLFVAALLRAGKLEVTSKGRVIDSALSLDARNTFGNNNLFRQASFRPKVGLDFTHVVSAAEAFKEVFGREVAELEQGVVAATLREEVERVEEELREAHARLLEHHLPGAEILRTALDRSREIRTAENERAILAWNGSYRELKEALRRARELDRALGAEALEKLGRARRAIGEVWPVLRAEADLPEGLGERAEELGDLLRRESFYRELPEIEERSRELWAEWERRHREAVEHRADAYREALETLRATPRWEALSDDQHERLAAPFESRSRVEGCDGISLELLRADVDACPQHLSRAVEALLRLLDGNRIVRLDAGRYFLGGIESEEQLEAALEGLREECLELIAAGKKVLIQ